VSKPKFSTPARTIPLSKIQHGHKPDNRPTTPKYANEPIHVEKLSGGAYRILDGNDRVAYARSQNRRTIRAYVADRPLGAFYWR
jgi:hypothetical protein